MRRFDAERSNAEQALAIKGRMEFGGQISGIQLTIRQLLSIIESLETSTVVTADTEKES